MFIASQLGMPTTEWQTFTLAQRRQFGGTGPCDYLNPQGKVVARKITRLVHVIRGYEAQVKAACAQVPRCAFDGPIYARQVHRRKYITEDLNHLSVAGHAWAARVAWTASDTPGWSAKPQGEEQRPTIESCRQVDKEKWNADVDSHPQLGTSRRTPRPTRGSGSACSRGRAGVRGRR